MHMHMCMLYACTCTCTCACTCVHVHVHDMLSCACAWTCSVTTSYLCGPGFPGASPCLKRRACIWISEVNRDLCAPAHRHLVVTGSAQLPVEVAPRTGGVPPACCPIHSSGSGRAASLGIAQSPAQSAVTPEGTTMVTHPRDAGSLKGVYRNSGVAALPEARVGILHDGGDDPIVPHTVARPSGLSSGATCSRSHRRRLNICIARSALAFGRVGEGRGAAICPLSYPRAHTHK